MKQLQLLMPVSHPHLMPTLSQQVLMRMATNGILKANHIGIEPRALNLIGTSIFLKENHLSELLVSSESAAPEGLYRWDYSTEGEFGDDSGAKTINKDEVWVIEINTADLLGSNASEISITIQCSEGFQSLPSDAEDQLDWSLEAPEGYSIGEQRITGTLDCSGFDWDWTNYRSDYVIPDDGSLATSRDDALSLISWTNMVSGIWTLSLTAQVNDGPLPLTPDSDLDAEYFVDVDGLFVDVEKQ